MGVWENMEITSAEFVKSSSALAQLPPPDRPEFAFIGRSNVGKSSLINKLTHRKALAKTSATPGKTRLFNHFLINKEWYLVDLPGYGYAKVSAAQRAEFNRLLWGYLRQRTSLLCLFALIDIRHAALPQDLEFLGQLAEAGVPFAIVFTKADKLPSGQLQRALAAYRARLAEDWEPLPTHFVTSSETGHGREEVLAFITETLPLFTKENDQAS